MQYSGNYKFLLPDGDDVADIADINSNTKAIDAELKNNKTSIQQVADGIGNGVLTIYQNGDSKGSFSANQTKNAIVHISVPTKVSQLEDDANLASISNKVDKLAGKGLSTNDFTNDYKNKLDGIASEANKTTVDTSFDSTSENPVQNKVIFTAISDINASVNMKVNKVSGKGLSTNDYTTTEKNKLAGIAEGANKYSLPTASSSTLGGVKIGSNLSISSGVLSAKDTTYSAASATSDGLMSAADKAKLDGVATGANKITVDTALNNASTNPIANAAVAAQFASIAPDIVSLKTSVANINKSLSDLNSDTETITEATFTSWLTETT